MAELSKELYNKLLLADSLDEVATLLKADGREDMSAQEAVRTCPRRRSGRRCSSAVPRTAWS